MHIPLIIVLVIAGLGFAFFFIERTSHAPSVEMLHVDNKIFTKQLEIKNLERCLSTVVRQGWQGRKLKLSSMLRR